MGGGGSRTVPARQGSAVKRIGDVMKHITIPIGPDRSAPPGPEIIASCPMCQDAGFVRLNVPPNHPRFGAIVPCSCRVEAEHEQRRQRLQEFSNFGSFDQYDFDAFDPSEPGTSDAFNIAMTYAQDPKRWLFFHGPCGVGKTHLAVAIARYSMEHHQFPVLFQVVPDLLDQLRASFDPAHGVGYDKRFEQIRDAGLLILDDLGTENTTPWAKEKLYQIFNHRYNEGSPTVVTSNQDIRMIDDRVASRLLDTRLTTVVEVDAEDFRRRGRADYVRGRRR